MQDASSLAEPDEADEADEIIQATAEQVLAVVEQMVDLPWPEGDEWLEWRLDGLEGTTSYLMHVLPLASHSDAAAVATFIAPVAALADQRWGARHHFDASRFTDTAATPAAKYDLRSAPAALVRSLDAESAIWWRLGTDAALLVVSSVPGLQLNKAAFMVLSSSWLADEAPDEAPSALLLADLLSGEKDRIISAMWEVFATRDREILVPLARYLPKIRQATADVELGGMLASQRSNLEHVLDRLGLVSSGACLCAAYPAHQFYDPKKEEGRQHVRIVGTVPNQQQWEPDRICECCDCGARFQVEQGEYHYTWWKWRPLTAPRSGRARRRSGVKRERR
ncbi:hypothetical protein GCM10027067_35860 [Pseudactinotalea suaedae]